MLFFSSLLLLLTSVSCEKNNIIETGDHSFSCYVNGKLFVPKAASFSFSTLPIGDNLVLNSRNSYFFLRAIGQEYGMFFNIENFDLGEFNIKVSNGDNFNYQLNHVILRTNGKTYLSKEGSGTVTFTNVSDTNVAGVFEFTLYNENDETDIIRVTKGKFNNCKRQ